MDVVSSSEVELSATTPVGLRTPRLSKPVILMVLIVASWASATVVSKHLYLAHLITPLTLVVCRFTLAGLFSLALFGWNYRKQRKSGQVALPLVGRWHVYLAGGILISSFILGFNLALQYITATLGGLVFFGLVPMVMLVVGHFWLGSGFGKRQLIGIAVALCGVLLVTTGGDLPHFLTTSLGGGNNLGLGLLLMVLGAFGWGVSGLWGKRYTSQVPGAALLSTGINSLIGVVPVWVLYLILEPNRLTTLQPEAWLYILYVGIVPSALGFALYYTILKDLTLNQAATIQLLSPVFTAVLAIAFLGEPVSLALLIGAVILLAGVRLSTRA